MSDETRHHDPGGMLEPTEPVGSVEFPSWEEFEARLASVLARMAADTYLVISAHDADGAPTYYVQFAQAGPAGFLAEAVSNRFLAGALALSPLQEEQMTALGWQWPSPRVASDVNYSRQWPLPTPFAEAAHLAVRTLHEVFGINETGQLRYKTFARGGHEFAQPALGIGAEPPIADHPEGQAAPATLEELRPLVDRAIREFLNTDTVMRDERGNVPISMGSAMVFVRPVDGRPPIVAVFSSLLRGVTASPALLQAINEINTRIRFGRVMWTGHEVIAAMEVSAVRITAEHIAFACLQVGAIADHFDDQLQARFGGATTFEGGGPLVN